MSEANPRVFTVTGFTPDPTCTATESPVPAGYSSTGTCSALLSAGTCTIANTLNSATFTVTKVYSDGNTTAVISISLPASRAPSRTARSP